MNAYVDPTELRFEAPVSGGYVPAMHRPSLLARIGAGIAWLAAAPRRNAVMAELSALSDRELHDIGLTRSELLSLFKRDSA
jgi:uncharacterized protein YjiS (DUF1127 family)